VNKKTRGARCPVPHAIPTRRGKGVYPASPARRARGSGTRECVAGGGVRGECELEIARWQTRGGASHVRPRACALPLPATPLTTGCFWAVFSRRRGSIVEYREKGWTCRELCREKTDASGVRVLACRSSQRQASVQAGWAWRWLGVRTVHGRKKGRAV